MRIDQKWTYQVRGPDYDVSDGEQELCQGWARHPVCCILIKNVAAFCQYPENLSEAELKNNSLFCLASGDVKTGEHSGYITVIAFCSHPSLQ